MHHLVYVTVNSVNLNFYIGKHSTTDLNDGYLGSGHILKRAIRKYGKDKFYRLDFAFFHSEDEAFEMEKQVLNELPCREGCYNIGGGGEGGDNISHNPRRSDIIEKMSRASKMKWQDEQFRVRINSSRRAAMSTDEHRRLRSLLAKELWANPHYRNMVVAATINGLNTEESRRKRSAVHTALWQDDGHRRKMMGILRSEVHRSKASMATKRLFAERPDILAKFIKARDVATSSPEHRRSSSERMKAWKTNPKLRAALTTERTGYKNPTWGSRWMFDPILGVVKKVQQNEISCLLSQGWKFGRPRSVCLCGR